jgi:serine/threonine-protein kinase SRPK3
LLIYTDRFLDISGRNIAFTFSQKDITEKRLFEILGSPEAEPLKYLDGQLPECSLPGQLVKAADWIDWIEEDEEEIRLIDFGDAFKRSDISTRAQHPLALTAPEAIFYGQFDYRADLWRAGCVVS